MNEEIFNSEYLYITKNYSLYIMKYKLIRYNPSKDLWKTQLTYNDTKHQWEQTSGTYTKEDIKHLIQQSQKNKGYTEGCGCIYRDDTPYKRIYYNFEPITLERFIADNFESLL